MKTKSIASFILCGFAVAQALAFEPANLVKNHGFDEVYENGMPADWENISHPNYLREIETSIEVTSQNFLRIVRHTPRAANLGEQRVALRPDLRKVRIGMRVRAPNIIPGNADWQAPGLSYAWILEDQKERSIGAGDWLLLHHSNPEWIAMERYLKKPSDAIGIKVSIMGNGWTGEIDFDEIIVEPFR